MSKRVLVTGLTGMLGNDLAPLLQQAGHVVVGANSRQLNLLENDDSLQAKVRDWQPEAIIHTAAFTDVDGAEQNPELALTINREGCRKLADIALLINIPLYMVSTDYVFAGNRQQPYTPQDKPDPQSVYGQSKYYGELILIERLTKYCILRTSWLYGLARQNFVQHVLEAPREGRTLRIFTDQVGSPTWTGSLSRMLIYALQHDLRGVYHAVDRGAVSRYEQALTICQAAGIGHEHIYPVTSDQIALSAKRPAYSVLEPTDPLPAVDWQESLYEYLNIRQARVE